MTGLLKFDMFVALLRRLNIAASALDGRSCCCGNSPPPPPPLILPSPPPPLVSPASSRCFPSLLPCFVLGLKVGLSLLVVDIEDPPRL